MFGHLKNESVRELLGILEREEARLVALNSRGKVT
jgi:hypothetical protein